MIVIAWVKVKVYSTMSSAQMQNLQLLGQDYVSCRNINILDGYIVQQGKN